MPSPRRSDLVLAAIVLVLAALLAGAPFDIWDLRRASAADQVENGGFEEDLSFWQLDLLRGAGASASRDTTTFAQGLASARIDITKPKNGLDTVQFYQGGLSLVEGQGYSLSFWARASLARPIEVVLRTPVSPWTRYLTSTHDLTTSWQQHSLCLAPGITDPNVTLHFGLGQYGSTVWLDGVEFDDSPITVSKAVEPREIGEPGGPVTFTVTVTNTGVRALTLNTMADSVYGDVTDPANPDLESTTCAAGEVIAAGGGTYSCTFQAQVAGQPGTHSNQVAVQAQDAEERVACAAGAATVTIGDRQPEISVLKAAAPSSVPEPGGPITFTVRVDNASPEEAALTALVDDVFGDLNGVGSCVVPQDLASDGSYGCTFTQPVRGAPGLHVDTVTATVEDDEGNTTAATGSAVVTITDILPGIAVHFGADPDSLPVPGGLITFALEIENTGSETVTLASLTNSDNGDLDGEGTCALPQTLPVGGVYACAFQAQVSGGSGEYVSVTTAVGEDDDGNVAEDSDSATVTLTPHQQGIAVLKSAAPASLPEPGGTVTFTVRVYNYLGSAMTLTSLVDDVYGNLHGSGSCLLPQTVAEGSFYECGFQTQVVGPPGPYMNTVTATALDDTGSAVAGQASVTVTILDLLPTIAVLKSADPMRLTEPGGTVTFTVRVDNTGSEDVTLSWLADSVYGILNGVGSCSVPRSVAAGGSYECRFQAQISGGAGEHTNQATATARDNEGNVVIESDTATVTILDVLPTITVVKAADPTVLPEPGGTVSFALRVGNHSVEAVTLYSLSDDPYGDLDDQGSCALPQQIAPDTYYECTFQAAVSGMAGDHVDTVTARARDDEGNVAQAADDAVVSLIAPGLQVTLTADSESAYVGETVSYLYTVRNGGDVTLTNVRAVDARLGTIALGSTVLLPGQVTTGTAVYGVRLADLPGPLTSSVTVYAQPPVGVEVSDTASRTVQVQMVIYLPLVGRQYTAPPV